MEVEYSSDSAALIESEVKILTENEPSSTHSSSEEYSGDTMIERNPTAVPEVVPPIEKNDDLAIVEDSSNTEEKYLVSGELDGDIRSVISIGEVVYVFSEGKVYQYKDGVFTYNALLGFPQGSMAVTKTDTSVLLFVYERTLVDEYPVYNKEAFIYRGVIENNEILGWEKMDATLPFSLPFWGYQVLNYENDIYLISNSNELLSVHTSSLGENDMITSWKDFGDFPMPSIFNVSSLSSVLFGENSFFTLSDNLLKKYEINNSTGTIENIHDLDIAYSDGNRNTLFFIKDNTLYQLNSRGSSIYISAGEITDSGVILEEIYTKDFEFNIESLLFNQADKVFTYNPITNTFYIVGVVEGRPFLFSDKIAELN